MSKIQTIMTADDYGQQLVTFARQTAETLVRQGLTTNQIRNIFTEVRKIEALWNTDSKKARRRLEILKPKMEYQTARTKAVGHLAKVLSEAIDQIQGEDAEAFERFVELFEAILAYHRVLSPRR